MRLFIAAELPDVILNALVETSSLLRNSVPGHYVAPELFHVTLAFLGNVEPGRVDCVIYALEKGCCDAVSFGVTLGDLGKFGRCSKATLWQGFRNAEELYKRATTIREALILSNLTFDNKAFMPHVTLMRAVNLMEGALPIPVIASGRIETVTLFQSNLSGERPKYVPLYSVSFPH